MSNLADFVMARWALLTDETVARNFQKQTGISANTINKEPELLRPDKRTELAKILRFASWVDLENAYRDWDVGRGIIVKISPTAYAAAKDASGATQIDEWVSRAVMAAAEKAK